MNSTLEVNNVNGLRDTKKFKDNKEKGRICDGTYIPWSDDKTNEVTAEFNRLNYTGNMPTFSDPKGKTVDKAMERLGAEKYNERLQELKRKYAEKVSQKIRSSSYERGSDEDKKEIINDLRQRYIFDRL